MYALPTFEDPDVPFALGANGDICECQEADKPAFWSNVAIAISAKKVDDEYEWDFDAIQLGERKLVKGTQAWSRMAVILNNHLRDEIIEHCADHLGDAVEAEKERARW